MEKLITANTATNLYWLGRHLQRIEAHLIEISNTFDLILDVDKDAGKELYKKLSVDLNYKNSSDFLYESIFGDHDANLYDLITYARENAIVARSKIEAEAFGEVMALYELFDEQKNSPQKPDYRFIDKAQSLINEILGILVKERQKETRSYFIKLGELVEKVDFYFLLNKNKEFALILMKEIDITVEILAPGTKHQDHSSSSKDEIVESINKKIDKVIVQQTCS